MSLYLTTVNGRTMRESRCLDTDVKVWPRALFRGPLSVKYPDQLLSLMKWRAVDLGIFV